MTREEGIEQMRALQKEHHDILTKGMDAVARALNKNDIVEVEKIVIRSQNLAILLKERAVAIIEELQRLESMRCPDTGCIVYDKEERSGCGLDPLLRADCKTWKEEMVNRVSIIKGVSDEEKTEKEELQESDSC